MGVVSPPQPPLAMAEDPWRWKELEEHGGDVWCASLDTALTVEAVCPDPSTENGVTTDFSVCFFIQYLYLIL